jgi:hypothetical protein
MSLPPKLVCAHLGLDICPGDTFYIACLEDGRRFVLSLTAVVRGMPKGKRLYERCPDEPHVEMYFGVTRRSNMDGYELGMFNFAIHPVDLQPQLRQLLKP